jgi:hypothetical protein
MRTATQRLADIRLGMPVEAWVRDQREIGETWRTIATMLRDATDGDVIVTERTLMNWTSQAA